MRLTAEEKMLDKNFCAKTNKNRTAEKFRFGLIFISENASDFDSRGGKKEGCDTDKAYRKDNVDLEKCKSYSNRKSIDACCNCEHQHCLESEGSILLPFFLSGFFDHIETDYSKKNERDPVVYARYILFKS